MLDDITRSNKIGRQNELSSYFYSDNAWVLGNTGNINSNHTQGLRTGIQFAETETGVNLSYDMSECCDPTQSDCANHKAMIEADLSRSKRKKIVDKVASTYILQGYLDLISR